MQPLQIIKTNCLTTDELNVLERFAQVCEASGGPISRLYWDAMKQKRPVAGNFLCYRGNNLVGYLGFFFFEESIPYVSAIIKPDEHIKEIFLHLFQFASTEASSRKIHQMIFSFSNKNKMAKKCLDLLTSHFLQFEYHMERRGDRMEELPHHSLLIKKANVNDIPLIATIDAACFGSDYSTMLQRFQETFKDLHREIWLAYLKEEGIGKVHLRFEEEGTFIHDVGIIPSEQKKGYGRILLKSIINNRVSVKGSRAMYLEVFAKNESALQLYKSCHFDIRIIYENWSVTF